MAKVNLVDLLRLLDSHFNDQELRNACFALGVDYDNLAAQGKVNKMRELIKFLNHRGRLNELLQYLKETRPHLSVDFFNKILSNDTPTRYRQEREVPELLPHLVDRTEQEYRLRITIEEWLKETPRPLICLIHGDESQSPDMFIERLKVETLPKMLEINTERTAIKEYPLKWPRTIKDTSLLDSRLQQNLADMVLGKPLASVEEINEALATYPGPIMIPTHVYTDEWKTHGVSGLTSFLKYWQEWPDLAIGQRLIVCLFIQYQNYVRGGWLSFRKRRQFERANRQITETIENYSFSQFNRLVCTVLPRLSGIKRSQVEDWVRREETRQFCTVSRLLSEVRRLYQEWEDHQASQVMPMEYLTERLLSLLDQTKSEF